MCAKCGEMDKYESMHGNCRGFALLQTGLAITVKERYNCQGGHDLCRLFERDRTKI